jgi:hypothetical protein
MVDLTDPVETITELLSDETTGLGTTGYTITNDKNNLLTLVNNDILVMYIFNKEDLRTIFGEPTRCDVFITVTAETAVEEWIGLTTKQIVTPVTLTVHVIDKTVEVNSVEQLITAALVRYKTVEAIRKFIKDHTSSPGGTIAIWELLDVKNENDVTTKPILWKAIVKTQATTYYTPDLPEETIVKVAFDSHASDSSSYHLGSISLDDVDVGALPCTKVLDPGVYAVEWTDAEFVEWQVSGLVSVEDSDHSSTILTVTGTGTATAIYNSESDNLDFEIPPFAPPKDWVPKTDDSDPCNFWTYPCYSTDADFFHGSRCLVLPVADPLYGGWVKHTFGVYFKKTDVVSMQCTACAVGFGHPFETLTVTYFYNDGSTLDVEFELTDQWSTCHLDTYLDPIKKLVALAFWAPHAVAIHLDYLDIHFVGM